jgi:hypothetical protein
VHAIWLQQMGTRGLFAGLSYGFRLYRASQAGEAAIAATPVGRLGSSFNAAGNNGELLIGGRLYSGHALDRLQERGAVPSVVEDIISSGTRSPGRYPGTTEVKGANGTVILGGKLFWGCRCGKGYHSHPQIGFAGGIHAL